ncbi:hypothetical protein [Pseudosulfitobacter sp. DSM 107133]|uniref:hypothetical protein n=1 Tax=Pseudosulfitobacter sp. DSM 107133 TaxID=2883100 RepID=UPI0013B3F7E5|nr:hypothetical protein [Pseudosulfitobacter sp. DSM 107133]
MASTEKILAEVVEHFLSTADRDQFNGLGAKALLKFSSNERELRDALSELIANGSINCVFSKFEINIHIKRFPDIPVGKQLECVLNEELSSFCVYPSSAEVAKNCDLSKWSSRPFSKALLLVEPQLSFRSFEMAALERYINDPRYQVHFADYMGTMSIGDEAYREEGFLDRDKVSLQTFGLGIGKNSLPYLIVFLRYLANLSPGHQQFWHSYLGGEDVKMLPPYYDASFSGTFWKNRSVRYAIIQEINIINKIIYAIYGQKLFRDFEEEDVPIGVTGFLRPTKANFEAFVLTLDKLLSDRIDANFFKGKICLHEEVPRGEGRFEVMRKGTISLLEEWLLFDLDWENEQGVRNVIIKPLREVRRLRQKPAHEFSKDSFDLEFHTERRRLLAAVLNSLQSMRAAFSTHRDAKGIHVPEWLDAGQIDFL